MKELYLDGILFSGNEEEFLAIENFHYKGWLRNGDLHRDDGPAIISPEWIEDGGYSHVERWYYNGKKHRIDGPAEKKIWLWTGFPSVYCWYVNDIDLTWMNDWIPLNYWICECVP